MIRQSGSHRRRAWLETAFLLVDLPAHRLHLSRQVIGRVFPDRRCFEHLQFFRERERFAYEPPIHLARSQVGALDIGGVGANYIKRLLIAGDDLDLDLDNVTAFAMFDDLQVMPPRLRLFLLGRKTFANWRSRWHFPPGLDHRLPVGAFSIGRDGRRGLGVTPILELFHQLFGDFFFGLGDGSSDAQSSVCFDGRAAPECPALVFFSTPFFSPL